MLSEGHGLGQMLGQIHGVLLCQFRVTEGQVMSSDFL